MYLAIYKKNMAPLNEVVLFEEPSSDPGLNQFLKFIHVLQELHKKQPKIEEFENLISFQGPREEFVGALNKNTELLNYINDKGNSLLHYFARSDKNHEYLKLLISLQADTNIDHKNMNGDDPLYVAIAFKQKNNFILLIKEHLKKDPNDFRHYLDSLALHHAKKMKSEEMQNPFVTLIQLMTEQFNILDLDLLNQFIKTYPTVHKKESIENCLSLILINNREDLLTWLLESNLNPGKTNPALMANAPISEYMDNFSFFLEVITNSKIKEKTRDLFFKLLFKYNDFNDFYELLKNVKTYYRHELKIAKETFHLSSSQNIEDDLAKINLLSQFFKSFKSKLNLETKAFSTNIAREQSATPTQPTALEAQGQFFSTDTFQTNLISFEVANVAVLSIFAVVFLRNLIQSTRLFLQAHAHLHEENVEKKSFLLHFIGLSFQETNNTLTANIPNLIMIPASLFANIPANATHLYEYNKKDYLIFKKEDFLNIFKKCSLTHKSHFTVGEDTISISTKEFNEWHGEEAAKFNDDLMKQLSKIHYTKHEFSLPSHKNLEKKLKPLKDNLYNLKTFFDIPNSALTHLFEIGSEIEQVSTDIVSLSSFSFNKIAHCKKAKEQETCDHIFEKKAATTLKNQSDQIKIHLQSIKLNLESLEEEIKNYNQPSAAPNSNSSEPTTQKKREKLSTQANWLFNPTAAPTTTAQPWQSLNTTQNQTSASSSASSNQLDDSHLTNEMQPSAIHIASNPINQPNPTSSQNLLLTIEEKAKIKLLVTYLKKIKVISEKKSHDDHELNTLRYLLMRVCVLLLSLKELSHSEYNMNDTRNAFIHSLSVRDGISSEHLLDLAKKIIFVKLSENEIVQNKEHAEKCITKFINVFSGNPTMIQACEIRSAWKKGYQQNLNNLDSISTQDALTQIHMHLEMIKNLFQIHEKIPSPSLFSANDQISPIIQTIKWHICAIHLCLQLCPSIKEHHEIKHHQLKKIFYSIEHMRNIIAHEDILEEAKLQPHLDRLKMQLSDTDLNLLPNLRDIILNMSSSVGNTI